MTDREIDRAAALVRATPIERSNGTAPTFRSRSYVPPSVRYGERWKSLPVEAYDGPGRRAPHGAGFAFAVLLTLALAGAAYIVLRFALSFL